MKTIRKRDKKLDTELQKGFITRFYCDCGTEMMREHKRLYKKYSYRCPKCYQTTISKENYPGITMEAKNGV